MGTGEVLGFIGLGVMGEPMARNLIRKSGRPVLVFDLNPVPVQRLTGDGAEAAASVADLTRRADVIFLSLPGEKEVRAVTLGPDGVLANVRKGQAVVDTSTAPVTMSRELAEAFAAKGVRFVDAPVARTRPAAIDGTLSVSFGGSQETFDRVEPLLKCMASDVTRCGDVGAGEAVKLLNNMVVSLTTVALAEALAVAKQSGVVDPKVLFEVMSKGSADSFVLRNHGMKSLLPDDHPLRAFPITYMLKDLSYALMLAESAGLDLQSANTTRRLLEQARDMGFAENYHTAVIKAVEANGKAG